MRTAEACMLLQSGVPGHSEVRPAWDGHGSYVVWVCFETRAWGVSGLLRHEDGAPLCFLDAASACAMARRCGFAPSGVRVRWPPIPLDETTLQAVPG